MDITTKIGITMIVWLVIIVILACIGTNQGNKSLAKLFIATFLSIAIYLLL